MLPKCKSHVCLTGRPRQFQSVLSRRQFPRHHLWDILNQLVCKDQVDAVQMNRETLLATAHGRKHKPISQSPCPKFEKRRLGSRLRILSSRNSNQQSWRTITQGFQPGSLLHPYLAQTLTTVGFSSCCREASRSPTSFELVLAL